MRLPKHHSITVSARQLEMVMASGDRLKLRIPEEDFQDWDTCTIRDYEGHIAGNYRIAGVSDHPGYPGVKGLRCEKIIPVELVGFVVPVNVKEPKRDIDLTTTATEQMVQSRMEHFEGGINFPSRKIPFDVISYAGQRTLDALWKIAEDHQVMLGSIAKYRETTPIPPFGPYPPGRLGHWMGKIKAWGNEGWSTVAFLSHKVAAMESGQNGEIAELKSQLADAQAAQAKAQDEAQASRIVIAEIKAKIEG